MVAKWFTQAFLENFEKVKISNQTKDSATPTLLPTVDDLTPRELEILGLVATGHSNVDIASQLKLSVITVRNYVYRTYQKINVHSRAEAVVWARKRNVLSTQ